MEPADQEGFGEGELLTRQKDDFSEQDPHRSCLQTGLGYAAALGMVAISSLSAMCAQALGGLVPPFELNGWRYVAQFIIVVPLLMIKGISVSSEREDVLWIVLAGSASVTFNICYFTAMTYLPAGTVGGVAPSSGMLLIALVAVVFDRKCALTICIACTLCVAGTLLVTQPSFLFKESGPVVYHPLCGPLSRESCEDFADNFSLAFEATRENNVSKNCSSKETEEGGHLAVGFGYLCILGNAVTLCILYSVINRKLSNVNGFSICFWTSIVGISSQFIIMPAVETPVIPKSPICIGLMLGHCFCAAASFVFMVLANQLIPGTIVSLLFSCQVVILLVAQYTVLGNVYPGKENWMEVFGAVLIFLGNITNLSGKVFELVKHSYEKFQ